MSEMKEIVVSSMYEMVEQILPHLYSELESNTGQYYYKILHDHEKNIRIFNRAGELVFFISEDYVELRDIVAEVMSQKYQSQERSQLRISLQQAYKDIGDENIPSLEKHNLKNLIDSLIDEIENDTSVTKIYCQFKYYNSEDVTFQKMTVDDKVLSSDTTKIITKIKLLVLEDLKKTWILD